MANGCINWLVILSIDEYYQNLKVIWNSKAHIINDRIYLNEQRCYLFKQQ